jgi:hypothetical protein
MKNHAMDLRKALLAEGFKDVSSEQLLRRRLSRNFVVEVATESGEWSEDETDAYIFLKSPRFADVMSRLFDMADFPFFAYEPRKMLNDETGTLAMVLAGIERYRGAPSLYSAAIHLRASRFGALLDSMETPAGFYRGLFEAELGRFSYIVEGMWAYLYLAALQKLKPAEILRRITSDKHVALQARKWHARRPVDTEVIDAYFIAHDKTVRRRSTRRVR